jgi:hypothetical protein
LWDRGIPPIDTLDYGAGARRIRRGRSFLDDEHGQQRYSPWTACALKLRGYRADSDHLQHHQKMTRPRAIPGNPSVKPNLSGEFTVINNSLVHDLSAWACGMTYGHGPQAF